MIGSMGSGFPKHVSVGVIQKNDPLPGENKMMTTVSNLAEASELNSESPKRLTLVRVQVEHSNNNQLPDLMPKWPCGGILVSD